MVLEDSNCGQKSARLLVLFLCPVLIVLTLFFQLPNSVFDLTMPLPSFGIRIPSSRPLAFANVSSAAASTTSASPTLNILKHPSGDKFFKGGGRKKLPKGVRHEQEVHIVLMVGVAEYLSKFVCNVSSCHHSKRLARTAIEDSLVWTEKSTSWHELTGARYGWVENVSARKDVSRLPVQNLRGHWYFWESLYFIRFNWAHYIFQYLHKLQDYLDLFKWSSHGIGLLVPEYHLKPMTLEFLRVLQVPYMVGELNQHYIVDDVYATHFSYMISSIQKGSAFGQVAQLFRSFSKAVLARSTTPCTRKRSVYLQRDQNKLEAGNRSIKNEDRLVVELKHIGFEIFKMGHLSFSDKVRTMTCLDKFVTQDGTNELNLGFANSPPRIAVLLRLMPWHGFLGFFQELWGKQFKYKFVNVDPQHGVSLDLVKKALMH